MNDRLTGTDYALQLEEMDPSTGTAYLGSVLRAAKQQTAQLARYDSSPRIRELAEETFAKLEALEGRLIAAGVL